MELGGSDAFVVTTNADIEAAATTAVAARINNNGQSCIAGKRFLVFADVYDQFVKSFVSKNERTKDGRPNGRDSSAWTAGNSQRQARHC